MIRFIIYSFITLITGIYSVSAQESSHKDKIENSEDQENLRTKINKLNKKKEALVTAEKEALKKSILEIEQRLEKGFITLEMAAHLKEEAAILRAENIANRTAIIDLEISLFERNNGTLAQAKTTADDLENDIGFSVNLNGAPFVIFKEKQIPYDRRTYSDFVVALGVNNLVNFDQDIESMEDFDFQLAGSRFFEIGWVWRTRLFKDDNFVRLNYGVMLQYNGLKPKSNQYVTIEDGETQLLPFEQELRKSKFRVDNLVFPMHLEFGRSSRVQSTNKMRYSISNSFRIGVGGYAGFNMSSRQKLKYTLNGERVKEKLKQGYDVSDFVYGLSAYAGRGGTQIYAKYDLSPMFANGPILGNNISLGLRFDL
jgi:hypothetical protein